MTTEKKVAKKPAAKKVEKKAAKKQINLGRNFRIGLVAVQAITSVLFIVSLVSMHIINGRDVFLLATAFIALLLLSAIKLLKENPSRAAKITCTTISILCIIGSVVAFRFTDAFNSFLNKITQRDPETKEYSVLVLSESNITHLETLKDKNIGYLKSDPKAGSAENYLQEKVKHEASFYDDVDTITGVLKSKISDAIVLESDRINAMKEEAENAIKNATIIYTFEIELESENVEIVEKDVSSEPFVLYISGSDSRSGIKATARSDVNIVAVVNPKQGKILLVSIPRDTYVQLHGTTGLKDKLTHAGIYGINMSKTTIEDLLSTKIDYTAKVSFDTVVKIVDQIDGIEIESDKDLHLKVEGKQKFCDYKVGTQHVDGDCALRFARERKSYTTGDRHRGENQQQVIASIIAKLSSSRDYLLKLPSILDIAADSFETSLSRDDITDFIRLQLDKSIKWEVESIYVNGAGSYQPTYSMGANRPLYVMITYPDSLNSAKTKIAEYMAL